MPERGVAPQASWATNERGDYDDQTHGVGAALPHDRHGDGSAAHVEGPARTSRQGSFDDHRRACARRVEPDPPTQCPCAGVRTGGLRGDAGERWTTGHTDTGTDLL